MIDTYVLDVFPGLPQIFVYGSERGPSRLLIAKVVDGFLVAGSPTEISNFRKAISDRFEVGRFSQDTSLVFNCLHIKKHGNGDIELYMDIISLLTLSRERKKQNESRAIQHELTAFLGLTGKLKSSDTAVFPCCLRGKPPSTERREPANCRPQIR